MLSDLFLAWVYARSRLVYSSIVRTRIAADMCTRTCGWLQSSTIERSSDKWLLWSHLGIYKDDYILIKYRPSKSVPARPSPPCTHICFWRGVKWSWSQRSADCCWLFGCLAITPLPLFATFGGDCHSLTFRWLGRAEPATSSGKLSASTDKGAGALILEKKKSA